MVRWKKSNAVPALFSGFLKMVGGIPVPSSGPAMMPPCYTRSKTLLSLMVNKPFHELMNTMDRKLSKLK